MYPDKKITIAIDGYSSCGKSTLAKALAKKLGYIFIDSGAMYRCITLFCLQNNWVSNDKVNEKALQEAMERIEQLETKVTALESKIS